MMKYTMTMFLLVDRFSPIIRLCPFSSRRIISVVQVSAVFMFQGVVGFIYQCSFFMCAGVMLNFTKSTCLRQMSSWTFRWKIQLRFKDWISIYKNSAIKPLLALLTFMINLIGPLLLRQYKLVVISEVCLLSRIPDIGSETQHRLA